MSLARDIAKELVGMFVADARLSVSILILVLIVWALAARLSPLLAGGLLVFGSLAVLVSTVAHEGRERVRR
jgi:hypothetical protein